MRAGFTFFILLLCCFTSVSAQNEKKLLDSVEKKYSSEPTLELKAKQAGILSQMYVNFSMEESEKWGKLALEHAEISRSRKAMVQANIDNGLRFSYLAGVKENIAKAIGYFESAYNIARTNKLEKETAECLLYISNMYRAVPDAEKAISYATQAFSIVSNTGKDSLLAAVHLAFGNCYILKDDKLLALKNYFDATAIAERIKNDGLLRSCYEMLCRFYQSVKDYDKALDYAYKVLDLTQHLKTDNSKYIVITDLKTIGDIYTIKKDYNLAQKFYEHSISKADSLRYQPLKFPGYVGLLNMYLFSDEPQKALEYFNSKPDFKPYLAQIGLGSVIDQAYGYIYSQLHINDSADYYFNKALPFFKTQINNQQKIAFFGQYGNFLVNKGDFTKGIEMLKVSNDLAAEIKDLKMMAAMAKELDSAYQKKGDYKEAIFYSNLRSQYKDSLDKLGKEDEILQLQINDEEKRKERLAQEAQERVEKRNRIQYMAIVIAIGLLFLGLVLLGFLRVSAGTIRVIGFFAFLMFFEFIFLVFKKSIYGITHGEPWKDLGMMILIAAILVPLHHWAEHKVIHYLSSQHMLRLRTNSKKWWSNLTGKNQ